MDIVTRCRLAAEDLHVMCPSSDAVKELSLAADEIECLRAELEKLRDALGVEVEVADPAPGPAQSTPYGEPLRIDGDLVYRLDDDTNCDEVRVTMWRGSRSRQACALGAAQVHALLSMAEAAGAALSSMENQEQEPSK